MRRASARQRMSGPGDGPSFGGQTHRPPPSGTWIETKSTSGKGAPHSSGTRPSHYRQLVRPLLSPGSWRNGGHKVMSVGILALPPAPHDIFACHRSPCRTRLPRARLSRSCNEMFHGSQFCARGCASRERLQDRPARWTVNTPAIDLMPLPPRQPLLLLHAAREQPSVNSRRVVSP